MTLSVRVIAPESTLWDASAEEVILPSATGQVGILTDHAPLLTALTIGVMQVRPGREWVNIALMGGFAEVEDNRVTVLVHAGERGDSIDLEEARSLLDTAESHYLQSQASGTKQEQILARQAFLRARARFQAAGGTVVL